MNVERKTLVEAGLAVVSVAIFVAFLVVGAGQGTGPGLSTSGAYTVIAGIVVFLFVMAGVGYWLSTREED